MANINVDIRNFAYPQCVQTHYDQPIVYAMGGLSQAQQNAGERINAKKIDVLDTTITPRTSTSKVLITISLCYEPQYNGWGAFYLIRRVGGVATEIGSPTNGPFGARPYGFAGFDHDYDESVTNINFGRSYLDSPATTNSVTYELWAYASTQSAFSFSLNRSYNDGDAWNRNRSTSQMILQEYFA